MTQVIRSEVTGMTEEIGLFEAMYNQRAIRKFKPNPVPDDLVRKLIESATKAPSGGNRQPWKFIVIRDPEVKQGVSRYYQQGWEEVFGSPASPPPAGQPDVRSSAAYLAEHMAETPVLILVCVEHNGSPSTLARGSSIYPAIQNLLLAAIGLGLGSVLTTLHKLHEQEIKDLLGIPEGVETVALLPIGFPAEGMTYGLTKRAPVDEVTYWDRWGA